jgi:hypothetical protein
MMDKTKLFRDMAGRELASAALSDNPQLPFTDRELNFHNFPISNSSFSTVRLDWLTLQGNLPLDRFEFFINYLQISLQDTFLDHPGEGGRCGIRYDSHILSVARSSYIAYSLEQDDDSDSSCVDFALQLKGGALSVFSDLRSQLQFIGELLLLFGDFGCSRFDIALDDWAYGAGPLQISPQFLYQKAPSCLSGFRKIAYIDSEGYFTEKGSLSTVHLGSRFSSKFFRIYQKLHSDQLFSLRYELENKDRYCKDIWLIFQEFARAYISSSQDPDLMDRMVLECSQFLRGVVLGAFDWLDREGPRSARRLKCRSSRCDWWQHQLDRLLDGAELITFSQGRIPSSLADTLAWIKRSVIGKMAIFREGLGSQDFHALLDREIDHYISRLDPQKMAEFRANTGFLQRSLISGSDVDLPDARLYPCPAGIDQADWEKFLADHVRSLLILALNSPGLGYLRDRSSDPYDLI